MTNKEAYIIDLDDILKDAENLLRIVSGRENKRQQENPRRG